MEMITLNLIPKGIPPVCHASQYDKGRVIRCNLVDGLQGYVLSGETAVLNVIKPDNNIVTEALTATTGNSYIDIITTEQMCAVAGKNECEIRLTKGEVEVGTLNFIMQVEADVTTGGIESETVIHDLKTTISDMIKEEIEAISPEEDLSGAMASFETHEIAPLVDCKVKIEAIQSGSGTPSPDNVRPITGFTGANIVNISGNNINLVSYIRNIYLGTYGFVDLGSLSWNYNSSLAYFYATLSDMKQATQPDELLNWVQNKYTQIGARFNVDWGSAPDKSIGTRQTTSYLCVKDSAYTDTTAFTNAMSGVYLLYELDTPTTPSITSAQLSAICNSFDVIDNVTAISWQDEAGTVYGGSLDVTSGVLTVTSVIFDLGSNNWSMISPTATIPDTRFYCNALKDVIVKPQSTVVASGCCDVFTIVSDNVLNTTQTTLENVLAIGSDGYIYVRNNDYSDTNAFKTAMSGHKFVYELATPVTYQLTPTEIKTILGVNNIWADTGDIDVVYHHELTARYVYFDNTGTDLTATDVEAAIKELWSRLQ